MWFSKNPLFGQKKELWVILKFLYIVVCLWFAPLHRQSFPRHFEPKITFIAQLEPKLWRLGRVAGEATVHGGSNPYIRILKDAVYKNLD